MCFLLFHLLVLDPLDNMANLHLVVSVLLPALVILVIFECCAAKAASDFLRNSEGSYHIYNFGGVGETFVNRE